MYWCQDLAASGARLDAQDSGGMTALMRAAIAGHFHVASWLMEAGCDMELLTKRVAMRKPTRLRVRLEQVEE